jgi:elongation factor P
MLSNLLPLTRQASFKWTQQRALPVVVGKRYYKLSVGSIKKGQVVQLKEKAWKVLTRDHVSTGRGGAVVKVKQRQYILLANNVYF